MSSPRPPTSLLLSLLLPLLAGPLVAQAGPPDESDEVTLYWPSEQLRTLQSAVDAAPDGATIRIAAGSYSVAAPVTITGKRLTIRGAGSGRRADREVTRLVGPAPRPVLDERGEVVLPAAAATGMFNLAGARVSLEKMSLSGFDAGITTAGRAPVFLRLDDVIVTETGRGIVALAPGQTFGEGLHVHTTLWHGIVITPPLGPPSTFWLDNGTVDHALGVGLYFYNCHAFLFALLVHDNELGGLVGIDTLGVAVNGAVLENNGYAAIRLEGPSGNNVVSDFRIENTLPNPETGLFGDGIVVMRSMTPVTVIDGEVNQSARAAISNFASTLFLGSLKLQCAAFELNGEPGENGEPFFLQDLGGVQCGCPAANHGCVAVSAGLQPPDPI